MAYGPPAQAGTSGPAAVRQTAFYPGVEANFADPMKRPAEDPEKAPLDPQAAFRNSEKQKKNQMKRVVADVFTFMLLTFFAPPLIMCMMMATNIHTTYFLGYWAWLTLLIVPLFFIQYVLHLTTKLPKYFFLAMVIVPCVLLTTVGCVYRSRLASVELAMENTDCTQNAEKRELQYAYSVGTDILMSCTRDFKEVPGTIEECVQYPEATRKIKSEMSYLKNVEQELFCAGICSGSVRLFTPAGAPAPPCHRLILEDVRASRLQATAVMWVSLAILLLSVPLYIFTGPLLDKYYAAANFA